MSSRAVEAGEPSPGGAPPSPCSSRAGWSRPRASELARLRAVELALDSEPVVTLSARVSKHRHEERLSLRGLQRTRLLAHGANPKTVQELMRHSTAELAMSVYAQLRPGEAREAVELLPDLLPDPLQWGAGAEPAVAAGGGRGSSVASRVAFRSASKCRTFRTLPGGPSSGSGTALGGSRSGEDDGT